MNGKQTYIVKAYDSNGVQINFWRWSCKRASTCKKQHLQAFRDYPELYELKKTSKLVCYETPDGLNESGTAWTLSHNEIIKELEA